MGNVNGSCTSAPPSTPPSTPIQPTTNTNTTPVAPQQSQMSQQFGDASDFSSSSSPPIQTEREKRAAAAERRMKSAVSTKPNVQPKETIAQILAKKETTINDVVNNDKAVTTPRHPQLTVQSGRAFHDVMTELCMNLTLAFMTPIEQIDCVAVSKVWSRTVRNPRIWSKATFLHDGSIGVPRLTRIVLPPKHIRAMLYGLNMQECSHDLLLSVLPKFHTVRSLEHSWCLNSTQEKATPEQLHCALSALKLESVKFSLSDTLLSALFRSHVFSRQRFGPAIWNYASTLTSIELLHDPHDNAITLASLLNAFCGALSEKKWLALRTIKLAISGTPYHSPPDFTKIAACFTPRCLPSLTSLDVQVRVSTLATSLTLQRLMSGHNLKTLTHLKHAFVDCEEYYALASDILGQTPPELLQVWKDNPIVYTKNLISFASSHQEVHWSSLRTIKSLTDLRLHIIRNPLRRSVELFDIIGAHNLPR